jgi:hypothetical protein
LLGVFTAQTFSFRLASHTLKTGDAFNFEQVASQLSLPSLLIHCDGPNCGGGKSAADAADATKAAIACTAIDLKSLDVFIDRPPKRQYLEVMDL